MSGLTSVLERPSRSPFLLVGGDEPVFVLGAPKALAPSRLLWGGGGRLRRPVVGGAVTASGMFFPTFRDFWDNSDLVFDWINDTVKFALFTNSITPSFSSDTAYAAAPYNANEIPTATGYTAGGVTLGTKTITESPTGTLMFDCADPQWTSSTFSGVRCGLTWDDTLTIVADAALWLTNFAADYAVTAGTLTVQLASVGLATIDLTP